MLTGLALCCCLPMDCSWGSADKELVRWQEGQPADLQERKQWPWWKAKKWMLHISHRLFQRYGDPKLTNPGSPERAFAELWKRHCSAQFLEAHMALLASIPTVSLCSL